MQECTLELDIDLCLKIQRLADSLKMSFSDCVVFLLNGFDQPNFLPERFNQPSSLVTRHSSLRKADTNH